MSTLILAVLDESGSMGTKQSDVIGGFNQFLSDQQKETADACRMSLVKFNTTKTKVYEPTPIADCPPLDSKSYTPCGNTALFDAFAESVSLGEQAKQAGERVICLVITDGEENSSRETSMAQIRAMIERLEKTGEWTFVYLGVDPAQWAHQSGSVAGVRNAMASHDMAIADFATMSGAMTTMRCSASMSTQNFYNRDNEPKNAAAQALGSIGGKVGGKKRAESLSPERRSEIAQNAAKIRWSDKDRP